MLSYKNTLLNMILSIIVIYGCTMCYLQEGDNRELEEKITISEKKLSKIREIEEGIEHEKESERSCMRELQTRKENFGKCTKLLEIRKSKCIA